MGGEDGDSQVTRGGSGGAAAAAAAATSSAREARILRRRAASAPPPAGGYSCLSIALAQCESRGTRRLARAAFFLKKSALWGAPIPRVCFTFFNSAVARRWRCLR